ncbi:hypothetical protein BCR43DRAFT_489898 [Syncephalastrum racemosum]|uniref:Uncharacterized protein n=1 Tax=Syncephalastrum racemosum TaxID=13706 RepID=A0A1X2HF09_SYNRA|nr:hypothetical protein BCR43DRAFT_489898 [Syncephalastrum racemosum]
MSAYELPSIYNQKQQTTQYFQGDEELDLHDGLQDQTTPPVVLSPEQQLENRERNDRRLVWLLLVTPLAMLIFTLIPVVTDLPAVNSMTSGDAIWRLFDPLVTLPLNMFIMFNTGPSAANWGLLKEKTMIWLLWAIGAAIYVQGHGIHLAAALFKHPVEDFMNAHPELMADATLGPQLTAIYLYMEDLWEHKIAHYMYAFGAMWMSWTQILAFRDQVNGPLSMTNKFVFALGSLVYGALLAAVAIEFPDGLYVGLVYTLVIGSACVLLITLNRRRLPKGGILAMGRRIVLQYYLGACVVGLIVVIAWIAKYGFVNRKAAGVA